VHHLFADHVKGSRVDDLYQINFLEADQPALMVNMVQIRIDFLDDMLQTILEESPKPYSEGSTSTCPPLPPGFGRELFMVSHDSIAIDGETSVQRHERKTRNANRQRCRNEEAKNTIQAAGGGPPPVTRNLQQEFLMVDNQQVEQTLSANLAVATHELARLPPTSEVLKIQALLKSSLGPSQRHSEPSSVLFDNDRTPS